jgi:hypothetical protein
MIWAIGFYWLCAGIVAVRMERVHPDHFLLSIGHVLAAMLFGGVTTTIRIMRNLAREPDVIESDAPDLNREL